MNKKIKTLLALVTLLILSLIPILVIAEEIDQNKTVYLDTGGKTGHLKYYEQYYIKNETGQLIIDQTRIYYDDYINNSKMKFLLIRPLTKEGVLYPDNQIKAVAILDNVTILNAWYNSQEAQSTINNSSNNNQELQHPELFIGIVAAILTVFAVIIIFLKKRK